MRFIHSFTCFLLLLMPFDIFSQSVFAPLNADYYDLIDRYEIKSGNLSNNFHSNVRPFTRKSIVQLTEKFEGNDDLSTADKFNLSYLQNDSWEWAKTENFTKSDSKKTLFNTFFKKKSDFYTYQAKNIDIHISPIFQFTYGTDNLSDDHPFLNTRGIEVRGALGKKLGFYTQFTENQTIYPTYVRDFVRQSQGFPYEGFTKIANDDSTKMLADFISARGYITFQAFKFMQLQFGHDKNYIGSGIRSLILSDFSAPNLQLKIITTLGRVQYTNIFAQLENKQRAGMPGDSIIPNKYMAFHHLNVNIGKNLNIGLFETVMFGQRKMGFDLNYLNPVIFYRYVEGNIGSGDNSIIGLDVKYNFLKHASIYGQVVIDEWIGKHIFAQDGSIGNKYALQGGAKYIDAFGIPNLDLQAEYNLIRPYTYSHFSTFSNSVAYNLSMVHPLGANLREVLAVARYQPIPKLTLTYNFSYTEKGEDYNSLNWGGNLMKLYRVNIPHELGNTIGQGRLAKITYMDFGANYMLKHNLFLDLHYQNRIYQSENTTLNNTNNNILFGIRWNTSWKKYQL